MSRCRGLARNVFLDAAHVRIVECAAVVHRRTLGVGAVVVEEVVGRVVDAVHAQVRGDAVTDLVPNTVRVGLVRQHVDEPRRDHEVGGVDRGPAGQRIGADRRDAVAVDADRGHRVVAGLGIDHSTTGDDPIEDVLRWWRRWRAGERVR